MFRENTTIIIASILSLIILVQYLVTKYGFKIGLAISYFFFNAILYMTAHNSILVRKNASEWLLTHLILLTFFGLLKTRLIINYWRLLLTSIVTSSVMYYLFNGTNYGLIDAYTFESAMLMFAFLMPTIFKKNYIAILLTIVAVITALIIGGSTCVGILAVYALGSIYYSNFKNLKILTAIGSIISCAFAYKFTDLLNDSGRFLNWAQYITYWHSKYNMIWGTGIGSFKNISPHAGDRVSPFLYAHNDFLEIYLETGLIGIIIFAYLCLKLLIYAHKTKRAHYVLMMFLFMSNYFPNQIMLCKAMFVLMIASLMYKNKSLT